MNEEQDSRKYTQLVGVWKDDDGEEWFVDFYLTNLEGSLECVGMSIRSFALPDDKEPEYQWPKLPHGSRDFATMHDYPPREAATPRPLRTAVLRGALLGKLLPALVQRAAEYTHLMADRVEEMGAPASLIDTYRMLDVAQVSVSSGPRRPGRPRKYTDEDLRRVAALYKAARATGSTSPYKDVARAMGLKNRGVVAKLIMACRRPDVGLLPPVPKTANRKNRVEDNRPPTRERSARQPKRKG